MDRAYLGVRLEPAPSVIAGLWPTGDTKAETNGDDLADGALLLEVLSGTPAALAGLLPGDKIVALDRQLINSANDLTDCLDRLPSQTTIRLEVIRGQGVDGQRLTVELRTSRRPETVTKLAGGSQSQVASLSQLPSSSAPAPSPRNSDVVDAPPSGAALSPDRDAVRASASPPRTEASKLMIPRALVDRLEYLERRLDKLERHHGDSQANRQTKTVQVPSP